MGWCRTVSFQSGGEIALDKVADGVSSKDDQSAYRKVGNQVFDLTQSSDWMEYLEKIEDREDDEGGAGAYDTIRCDIILSQGADDDLTRNRVLIWGQDYHLERLENSFCSLIREKKGFFSDRATPLNREKLDKAVEQSNRIITELVSEAESSIFLIDSNDTLIQLFRVTLLWSNKTAGRTGDLIYVRGHVTSSCKPLQVHQKPEPIIVSVAAHSSASDPEESTNKGEVAMNKSLPTRYTNPQNKIASWCRERKQIEKPHYKPADASEVLMVRSRLDEANKRRLEVLEGLSSNFFAIYKDGTLRTATDGVLYGYVRYLVLSCANKIGLEFDPRPIFLHDANEWQEAFITSSSRLIYPISKVLLPEHDKKNDCYTFTEHWKYEPIIGSTTPDWEELLREVMKAGGYYDA